MMLAYCKLENNILIVLCVYIISIFLCSSILYLSSVNNLKVYKKGDHNSLFADAPLKGHTFLRELQTWRFGSLLIQIL